MAVKSTKIETPITDILRGLGFSQVRKRQHVLWNACSKDGSSKIAINERRETFFLDHFDVAIATENIEQSIQDGLKKTWGKSTKLYYDMQQDGSLQFVVEWQKERDPTAETYDENTTPSLISWVVRISKHTSDVTIFFQDIHLLGKSFPPNWFFEISKCSIIGILGKSSKHLECISIFEYQIDSATLAFTKLFPKISNEELRILKENTTFEKDLELGLTYSENEDSDTDSDRQLVFYGHRKGSDESQLSPNNSRIFSTIAYLPPSIEVLESRAAPDLVRFFDQRLLTGKQPKIELESLGNAIRTRLDIALLKGFSHFVPQNAVPQLTSMEQETTPKSNNSINLSYKLHQNFFGETRSEDIIENLSQWYSSFSDAFSNHLRFESPTSIFIEHLGDAYKNQFPEQAAKAYLEALNQHEKPRILKKLAATYCGLRKTEDELKIQLRRLHCERRQPDLSSIRERLAELWISKNQSKLASNMLDILIDSRVPPKESWIQTSLQISKLGDSRLALDLLTRIGNNLNQKQNETASPENLKKINLELIVAIATIWVTDLQNPQNALYQLRKIIENSPSLSLDRIVFAEESLTTIGLIDEAFASRWKRWLAMPSDQKSRQLKLAQSIFDHLKTKDPSQLHLDVLKELIILGYKPVGLLEELHHWQTCEMKWNQFISEINRHIGTIEFNHLELIELSALARNKCQDHQSAIEFLNHSDTALYLDQSSVEYVVERLNYHSTNKLCQSILVKRLKHESQEIIADSLIQLTSTNSTNDPDTVNNACINYWIVTNDSKFIFKRINLLVEQKDWKSVQSILEIIQSKSLEKIEYISLLSDLIANFLDKKIKTEGAAAELIAKDFAIFCHDSPDRLQHLLRFCTANGISNWELHTIKKLIDSEIVPDSLNDETVFSILKDDQEYYIKFSILLFQISPENKRLELARMTIGHLVSFKKFDQDMVDCFEYLIEKRKLKPSDLPTIEELASKCGFHQLHIESLTMLALDSLQKQDAKKYFLHAADIAKIQLNDPILSYEKLKLGLKDSDDPIELLRLARSAFEAGNLNHANHIASTFLRDPRCLETTDLSIEFCSILNQSDETKSLATNIIQTLISWSETSGLTEYTAKLITFAVKNSLASKALLQREIVRQASINNLETATFYLVKWLQKIDSQRDSLPQLVDVLRDDFSSIGHLEFWCKLLEETSKEHNLIKLSGVARQEILIRYSQWLQESERDRQKTLSVFFDIYRENPNEVRIWVPLYLLLEEINDDRRLIPLLDRIIPRVESKPEIIDKYPINVETMKASLRRARTRAVLKKDDFHLQEPEVLKEELSKPSIVQTRDDKVKVIQQEIMDHIPLINFQFSNSIPEDSQSGAQSFLKDEEEASPSLEDPSKSMNLSSSFTKSEASTINGSSIDSLTAANWREFIRPGISELPVNLSKMKTSDFKSEEERHIFLQAIFICTGNAQLLKKMIWRPWRNPLDFGYSIVDKRRQTHDTDNVMFKTERGRNLSVLSTPLSRQMRNRVLIDFYLKSKNPLAKLKMNTVSHGHEIIQRTALRFFVEKLGNEKYFFVDTPEIGDKVFVDPIAKSIHFSIESIAKFQPSYFFHQVAIQTSILKSEHFYLLNAKIPQEFLPLLQYVRGYRPPSKIDKIRDTLKPDQNRIEHLFDGLDIKKIQTLIQNIGHLDQSDLEVFQFEILRYHLRKQLASTLDLVGIIESMTGLDLEKSSHEDIRRVAKKNPQIIDLIKYCTKLEF